MLPRKNLQGAKGMAHLCLFTLPKKKGDTKIITHDRHGHSREDEVTHFIQGHFIDMKTRKAYGIMGVEIPSTLPDCCQSTDDPSVGLKLTIIDFETKEEIEENVEKTGGDYVRLSSQRFSFSTSTLHVDKEAEDMMAKYFPKISKLNVEDAIVCTGELQVENFFPIAEQKTKDVVVGLELYDEDLDGPTRQ